MMGKIKYTTLIDYVLFMFRDIKKHQSTMYASLVQVLKIFDYQASFGEVQELGRYLEARGWAKVIYPLGDVRAQITPTGLLYLEEKGEDMSGAYKQFLTDCCKDKTTEELLIPLFQEEEDPKIGINKLLDVVINKIKEKEGQSDILKDIEVIKLELSKTNPDFRLIEIKLNNLGKISYIVSELQELLDYLTPQFSSIS